MSRPSERICVRNSLEMLHVALPISIGLWQRYIKIKRFTCFLLKSQRVHGSLHFGTVQHGTMIGISGLSQRPNAGFVQPEQVK